MLIAIEGDVGMSPTEGDWLSLAARVTGKTPRVLTRVKLLELGSLGADQTLRLYIDLGSATQSSRPKARGKGLHYMGFDTREWVYSAEEEVWPWVQNWVLDYTSMTPQELWDKVCCLAREEVSASCPIVPEVV